LHGKLFATLNCHSINFLYRYLKFVFGVDETKFNRKMKAEEQGYFTLVCILSCSLFIKFILELLQFLNTNSRIDI